MQTSKFVYNAFVTSVYDGDTIKIDIDLGFGIWLKDQTIRLYGINAPEVKGESKTEGMISRDRLRDLILNKPVIIETVKDTKEKFGRWLGKIFVDQKYINDIMVTENLAKTYIL